MKHLFSRMSLALVAALSAVAESAHSAVFGYMANRGMILGVSPIAGGESYAYKFAMGKVVNSNLSEIIRQRYYDTILYPLAGAAQLSFFALPLGQGVTTALGAVVGSAKTRFDTNMENANQLPSGKTFLIESIEIIFEPGSSAAASTFVPAVLGDFTAAAADPTLMVFNDVNTFVSAGLFNLNILAKNYLSEIVAAFPPKVGLDGVAALSSNGAATGANVIQYARNSGRPYYIDPMLTLQPAVNFEANITYPAAVAMPSGFNGRVRCILDGVLTRASQ